jgi:hypothetical protein
MTARSYQHLEQGDEERPVVSAHTRSSTTWKTYLVGLAAALAVIVVVIANGGSNSTQNTESDVALAVELQGMAKVTATRACTFKECIAARCDHTLAPFTCLFHNGGPHGGCSDVAWSSDSCTDSCDLSGCSKLSIPSSVPSCKDQACTKEWCKIGQLCGSEYPYQCTDGPGRFGCSNDEYHWVLNECPCCDATSCE